MENDKVKWFPRQAPSQTQQVAVDLKNAVQQQCSCGGKIFSQGVKLYIIPSVVSPTGQELLANLPAFACMHCKKEYAIGGANQKGNGGVIKDGRQ